MKINNFKELKAALNNQKFKQEEIAVVSDMILDIRLQNRTHLKSGPNLIIKDTKDGTIWRGERLKKEIVLYTEVPAINYHNAFAFVLHTIKNIMKQTRYVILFEFNFTNELPFDNQDVRDDINNIIESMEAKEEYYDGSQEGEDISAEYYLNDPADADKVLVEAV